MRVIITNQFRDKVDGRRGGRSGGGGGGQEPREDGRQGTEARQVRHGHAEGPAAAAAGMCISSVAQAELIKFTRKSLKGQCDPSVGCAIIFCGT